VEGFSLRLKEQLATHLVAQVCAAQPVLQRALAVGRPIEDARSHARAARLRSLFVGSPTWTRFDGVRGSLVGGRASRGEL